MFKEMKTAKIANKKLAESRLTSALLLILCIVLLGVTYVKHLEYKSLEEEYDNLSYRYSELNTKMMMAENPNLDYEIITND